MNIDNDNDDRIALENTIPSFDIEKKEERLIGKIFNKKYEIIDKITEDSFYRMFLVIDKTQANNNKYIISFLFESVTCGFKFNFFLNDV